MQPGAQTLAVIGSNASALLQADDGRHIVHRGAVGGGFIHIRQGNGLYLREEVRSFEPYLPRECGIAGICFELLLQRVVAGHKFGHALLVVCLAGGGLLQLMGELQQAVALGTLDEVQAKVFEVVEFETPGSFGQFGSINLPTHGHNVEHHGVAVYILRDDLGPRLSQFLFHETTDVAVGYAFAHNTVSHDGGRYHGEYHDAADNPLCTPLLGSSQERPTGEMHQADTDEGGNGDEDGVDEEQVERSKKIEQVACG